MPSDYEIFSPQALFGVFLGGDMFVLSTMATKVKVTRSMLHTLDYQNRGRRQCSHHKIPFIYSLIVGISETIPGLAVDLLSWWVWPLLAVWRHRDLCLHSDFCIYCMPCHVVYKHLNNRGQEVISALNRQQLLSWSQPFHWGISLTI